MNEHEQGGQKSKRAFTLVEVAIATALLVMSLALFLGTFVSAKRSAVISNNHMLAIEHARSNMEILVSSAYLASSLSNGAHTILSTIDPVTNTVPSNNIIYSVAIVTQAQGGEVKNIYLTNRWINPGAKTTSTVSLAGSLCQQLHP